MYNKERDINAVLNHRKSALDMQNFIQTDRLMSKVTLSTFAITEIAFKSSFIASY